MQAPCTLIALARSAFESLVSMRATSATIKLASSFLPNFCRLRVIKLDITLKLLHRFLYAAYHLKEKTLGFLSMYKNKQSNEK